MPVVCLLLVLKLAECFEGLSLNKCAPSDVVLVELEGDEIARVQDDL